MNANYKRTDIGMIPEDWGIDKISNLAKITTGSKNTQDKEETGKYPFFVRSQKVERINTYSFNGEAILTAGDGVGTGKIFHYIKGKFDYHQRVYKISDFREDIDGYFFYLYFSNYFLKRIQLLTAKSSVDSVRGETIKDMEIPIPPIKEQSAIAQVLSDTDQLIESLDKLIQKKKKIKQGAMQELLTGRKRLPGFSEEWEEKSLGELGQFTGGIGFPIQFQGIISGEIPFFKVSDMNNHANNVFMYTANNYLSGNIRELFRTSIIQKNSIVFAKIGAAIFLERKKILAYDSIIDNNMMGFTVNSGIADYKFIRNIFLNMKFGDYVSATALPSLNGKELGAIKIKIPKTIKEQQAIAQVLSDMDLEIEELERKRDKYQEIKKGMMQKLLTGEIRLKCKQ